MKVFIVRYVAPAFTKSTGFDGHRIEDFEFVAMSDVVAMRHAEEKIGLPVRWLENADNHTIAGVSDVDINNINHFFGRVSVYPVKEVFKN